MKHLRKYNESIEEEFDTDYISNCFIDLIDKGADVNIGNGEDFIWNLSIKLPEPKIVDEMSIPEFMDYNKKLNEIYKEIEYSFEKVSLKLDYVSNIQFDEGDISSLTNRSYDPVFAYFSYIYVVFTKKESEE